jgi:hypothetical protein
MFRSILPATTEQLLVIRSAIFMVIKQLASTRRCRSRCCALPDDLAVGDNRPRAGDIIWEDNNSPLVGSPIGKQFADTADGKITPDDRTYLGKTIPDFFYGFNIGANFKGFDLAVFFQGVSGIQVYNSLRQRSGRIRRNWLK